MPITFTTGMLYYKDENGNYQSINAASNQATAAQIAAIQQAGAETIASIPVPYTALQTKVNNLSDSIVDEYSSDALYSVGMKRMYNGRLYRCTTEINAPEDFTPDHWAEIRIINIINDNMAAVTVMTGYLSASIAQAYSNDDLYSVGALRMHENQLYRCTTEINVPEEFTPDHWTATNIWEEVQRLLS